MSSSITESTSSRDFPCVCVMMSTYNGEKYLSEQIDSILAQSDVDVLLYIRDDGSKDSTVDIIEKYMEHNKNICFLRGENCGVAKSFMNLVYEVPADVEYYAFADQDDIWELDKLIAGVRALRKDSGVMLYGSNQENVDSNGNNMGMRYQDSDLVYTVQPQVLEKNMIAGCTFVIPNRLIRLLKDTNRRPADELLQSRIHDVWVINVATVVGKVFYDKDSHMKYRQHGGNVVGAYSYGFRHDLKQKWKKLTSKKERCGRSLMGKELCRCFPEYVGDDEILNACRFARRLKGKKVLLRHMKELRRYSGETAFGLLFKIVFNLF